MKLLTGITLGITLAWAWRRYAGTLLWTLFSRGDT